MNEQRNVCVVIDYENVHCNLRSEYTNVFEKDFFGRLRKYLEEKNMKIIDIIAYCNFDLPDLHNSYHQSKLHEFGIDTRHTSNNKKNYADIQITVDMLDTVYNNNLVDGIVLISDDKDMTPLIKAIKRKKGLIHLITSQNSGDLILQSPTSHSFYEDLYEIQADNDEHVTESIYNSLKNHIQKEFIDKAKVPPLVSLDRVIGSNVSWHRLFEYEIMRHFKKLETEGRVHIHTYRLKDKDGKEYGKPHTGIVTDEFLYLFGEENPIVQVKNFFSDQAIIDCYKKYIKSLDKVLTP